ncbi:L-2,4-diaminobutyric acid acetyltransferase [Frankliniella fusca]|uniref:L-2,4-diaminobutyric acid acetyltransferase n=1 Tax=Frankliniella fusca TaxID=407009 RepID=A0AAE1L5D9_9NEOP|nr:L-2,4-diaminobutyric acid acetyltransferase [Frankliniella fusca]
MEKICVTSIVDLNYRMEFPSHSFVSVIYLHIIFLWRITKDSQEKSLHTVKCRAICFFCRYLSGDVGIGSSIENNAINLYSLFRIVKKKRMHLDSKNKNERVQFEHQPD